MAGLGGRFGTEQQRGAQPAVFTDAAGGIVAAGMSDLARAAEPAVQHFWLQGKSFTSLAGLNPMSHFRDAALLFCQGGALKHHWWPNSSLQVLRSWFRFGPELSRVWM